MIIKIILFIIAYYATSKIISKLCNNKNKQTKPAPANHRSDIIRITLKTYLNINGQLINQYYTKPLIEDNRTIDNITGQPFNTETTNHYICYIYYDANTTKTDQTHTIEARQIIQIQELKYTAGSKKNKDLHTPLELQLK